MIGKKGVVALVVSSVVVLSAGAALSSATARAENIFVGIGGNNTIGEYTTDGATVNASLVSGLDAPMGIAVLGSDLFVAELPCLDRACSSQMPPGARLANTPRRVKS
jgi:hypothetical protein